MRAGHSTGDSVQRGDRMLAIATCLLFPFVLLLAPVCTYGAGTLLINANTTDPAPRAAWQAAVRQFETENPDVHVEFNVYDHESYKKAIRNWLTSSPPDVVFWFAGNRMRQFVAPGLLDDVSALFTPAVKAAMRPAALDLVTFDGRQYGVPYQHYQIGFYFRSDLLAAAGILKKRRAHGATWYPRAIVSRPNVEPSRSAPGTSGPRQHGSITSICARMVSRSTWS